MKCRVMRHFILVFIVCPSLIYELPVSSIQMVNGYLLYFLTSKGHYHLLVPPSLPMGVGVLSYSHTCTYVGSDHFLGVQNFKFQYFWRFLENEHFLGINILWIFLRGTSQNLTSWRGNFFILGVF